jgi:hypothetical protein
MITKTDITLEKVVETLTGFEEDRILERFGAEVEDLLEERPRAGMRALAAVVVARGLGEQADAAEVAHQHVMGLTLKQISEFFPKEETRTDPASALPGEAGAERQVEAVDER